MTSKPFTTLFNGFSRFLSQANSIQTPPCSPKAIAAFKSDPVLQANLMRSFERILGFLGLSMTEDGKVAEGDSFPARTPDVWASPNHNWLRITRILRSLTLLGMETQAKALFDRLEDFYRSQRFSIPANTFRFWKDALAK